MTNRERAQERLNNAACKLTIKGAQEAIAGYQRSIDYYNSLPIWKISAYDIQLELSRTADQIEILEAVIEILTEQAEAEIAVGTIQTIVTLVKSFPKTTVMRKMVAMIANKLRKLGISLSECFRRAWSLVKGFINNDGIGGEAHYGSSN